MMGKIPPVPGAERTVGPAVAGAVPGAGAGPARRVTPVALAITLTTALALFLRLWQLTKHGYLLGPTEYDDGVYFGGALRLIHGAVPYKDFVTVQPPGVMLLMTPAALFAGPVGTAKALFIGRVLTACAGAAGVTLTGLLIRHRGALAVAVAGGFLAVYPDGVYAAHTVLIEPWLVLFCLAGALAVLDGDHLTSSGRRLAAGGVAFGFAGVCKAWAILPVIVLVILLLRPKQAGWRRVARRTGLFLGGTVAGFVLPVLPFAILAPSAFYNSVIVAQWARTDDVRIPTSFRVASMLGLSHGPSMPHLLLAAVAAAIAALAAGCSLLATLISRRWPPLLELFVLATAALIVLAFVWPPDYYYHYAAFLGPFLALAVVLPVARLAGLARPPRPALGTARETASPDGAASGVPARPGRHGRDRPGPGGAAGTDGARPGTPRDRERGDRRREGLPAGLVRADRHGVLHDRRQPVLLDRAGLHDHGRQHRHRLRAVARRERGERRGQRTGGAAGLAVGAFPRPVRVAVRAMATADAVDLSDPVVLQRPLPAASHRRVGPRLRAGRRAAPWTALI